ncbi:MAG TPA: 4a-hydroxytetrahydrobiopterin dehydratase [Planctomycetota bacterium]|jgi:4a-hydroxytetrahydrobiopterin dehydratase|nr:4a-hydroxytetrahydrobiopterin dehydratase [Planctomycetota bacterium]
MVELAKRRCVACEGGLPKVAGRELAALRRELDPNWEVDRGTKLRRAFAFDDFAGALRLANEIGALAEKEWHHPDLELGWGRVVVSIQTHAVGGLTMNDFVLAAKIDRLVARRGTRKGRRRA